jgi:uncharacterized protein YecT (DUF1311 family)
MRTFLAVLCLSSLPFQGHADAWVCPPEIASSDNGDFCGAAHAEFNLNQADKRLNEVYRQLLSEFTTKVERQPWITAQRAWLKFSDAHCAAALSKFIGAPFTIAEMEHSCRAEQIINRTKELERYCESCSSQKP